jgi:hypothetical protein
MESGEPVEVARLVTQTFERLGIKYAVVGSLASSLYGMPRSTQDVDIVAAIKKSHVYPLAEVLKNDFYIDVDMIQDAVNNHSSFNLIHLDTMLKVDIFPLGSSPIERKELKRAEPYCVSGKSDIEFFVAQPEDILLQKLKWYRQGGEISDQQWKDVLGILEVQEGKLDVQYLEDTARELGIRDLLLRAVQGSEIDLEL